MGSTDQASCFRDEARNGFLGRISIHPQARVVLEELAGEPMRAYEALALSVAKHARDPEFAPPPNRLPLQEAVVAWMAKWNLTSPWIVEVALNTLSDWESIPLRHSRDLRERREWSFLSTGWMEADRPGPPMWNPQGDQSAADAQRSLEAWFKAEKAEIARQKKEARARGLPTEPARYQNQTVDWAIRFQVLKESFYSIAAKGDSSGVRRAVHDFLDFIRLPAREAPRGRPAGKPKR
jgi:hypothetical protein